MPKQFYVQASGRLTGAIRVPGDKSISHRSVMLGSLSDGTTEVTGFLQGADAISTMNVFRQLGVEIEGPFDEAGVKGRVRVKGVGIDGLKGSQKALDCGNAGTAMRLLMGLLAGQAFESTLIGDSSLSQRPMRRVSTPLGMMGASLQTNDSGTPPVRILPAEGKLKAIDYQLPMASAQVKSAILLAGLMAQGTTSVTEPAPTRDHTERMLRGFGVNVITETIGRTSKISITGGQRLKATNIDVPADISSAAFFMVAASIAPDSDLTLLHVGINPTRTGIIEILKLMGANIEILNVREVGGEPVADLRVRSAQLTGIAVPEYLIPLAIDEVPVLFIAAACATGKTVVTGAQELRVKESDRISMMEQGLQALKVNATATADGMIIEGLAQNAAPNSQVFAAGTVESDGDHRIAMAFAVAALRAAGPITILDTDNVATSFPGFADLANKVGMRVGVAEHASAGK
jgi:3-phosphoshikimate 1-carboxyvinyltransferase